MHVHIKELSLNLISLFFLIGDGSGGGGGKARAATKVNPTVVNAVHAFYYGEGIDTECPDYNITQHASTGRRYPSAHAFYSSMHGTNTRKSRGKDSNLTDCPVMN